MAIKKVTKKPTKKKPIKYTTKNNVQFVGLEILNRQDQQRIKDVIYNEYITLERELKKIKGLKLHFKEYEKGGRKKYAIHMLVDCEGHPITASGVYSQVQWDAVANVHNLIEKAKTQIIKKFRTNESYSKKFYKLNFVKRIRDSFFK